MKKYAIVLCIALSVFSGCYIKEEKEEEENYNPYDTSEMEARDASDTINLDSAIRSIHLQELK